MFLVKSESVQSPIPLPYVAARSSVNPRRWGDLPECLPRAASGWWNQSCVDSFVSFCSFSFSLQPQCCVPGLGLKQDPVKAAAFQLRARLRMVFDIYGAALALFVNHTELF